jgi:hypothetical protein
VRDKDRGAAASYQRFFKLFDPFEIKMVGRLVKDEQVGQATLLLQFSEPIARWNFNRRSLAYFELSCANAKT